MKGLTVVYALGCTALAGLGLVLSSAWEKAPASRLGADAGVLLSAAASLVALALNGRAVHRAVRSALTLSVGGAFGRLVLWGAGMGWARHVGADTYALSVAYFGFYGVWLWLEVAFFLSASRSDGGATT